jgi:1,4-dihydroxy-2-naphthoate polyprenyltransferase
MSLKNSINTWAALIRWPFFPVVILPFIAGSLLAWKTTGAFNIPVFCISLAATVMIMAATHLSGEFFDVQEDTISAKQGFNPFAGGSHLTIKNVSNPNRVKTASIVLFVIACMLGLLLQFYFKTGMWTIPLGLTGIAAGGLYSTPPVRWSKRGIGEILIGYSFGWLPIAVGFYLQAHTITSEVHWMAIPVACTIFNVVLINEFSDYIPDSTTGKKNLLVRVGQNAGAKIYIGASVISWVSFIITARLFFPPLAALLYIPVLIFSAIICVMMLAGYFNNLKKLVFMCGSTIVINLATAGVFMAGLFLKQ